MTQSHSVFSPTDGPFCTGRLGHPGMSLGCLSTCTSLAFRVYSSASSYAGTWCAFVGHVAGQHESSLGSGARLTAACLYFSCVALGSVCGRRSGLLPSITCLLPGGLPLRRALLLVFVFVLSLSSRGFLFDLHSTSPYFWAGPGRSRFTCTHNLDFTDRQRACGA
jgi:hypothetical protein